ncbi:MAG: hypothetical protein RBU37_05505 [Myxococcota bacterium]|jgi:hypothetical protein|nr:hypothetical protein [Myxococcota bacterium]
MESWQVTLLILFSMLLGALIPIMVMIFLTLFRTYKRIAQFTEQMQPTVKQLQLVAERAELLSRGLEGSEAKLAQILDTTSKLAERVERNMSLIGIASSVAAVVGPAVSAFMASRNSEAAAEETEEADEDASTNDENEET